MNTDLSLKTKQWMELERKTMEQRRIADRFYEDELMSLIEEEYVNNNKQRIFEKVNYLIVSVGTSYEPIVLNIKLFTPNRILFLYTNKSEETLNKVVQYCKLLPEKYEKAIVSEVEPVDIYREIKKAFLKWDKPPRVYVDITGGTKAMSSACALAGTLIDIQMIYVSSTDYLVDFRKPNPGSERLNYIENPIIVFGDMEIDKAVSLFATYNFVAAKEKLAFLKEIIPDSELRTQVNFIYLLASAYEAWDSLDFISAHAEMKELDRQIKRDGKYNPKFLLVDFAGCINWQCKQLEYLKEIPDMLKERKNAEILSSTELIHALMFTMYQNGITRIVQEKYDMATLLFYRLLEMISQRRLIKYGIFASKPEYSQIRFPVKRFNELKDLKSEDRLEWLKDKVYETRVELFRNVDRYLPNQIALLDGYIILAALGDPIISRQKANPMDAIKQIRSMVFLRNNSIFAHGLGPVGEDKLSRFAEFVKRMFKLFCEIERVSFAENTRNMEWLLPQNSVNYMQVWE